MEVLPKKSIINILSEIQTLQIEKEELEYQGKIECSRKKLDDKSEYILGLTVIPIRHCHRYKRGSNGLVK